MRSGWFSDDDATRNGEEDPPMEYHGLYIGTDMYAQGFVTGR